MEHQHHRRKRRPGLLVAAGLISIGLIAAACGSDKKETTDTTTGATTTVGGATTTGGAAPTTAAATTTAAPKPTPGGKLVVAVEAEAANPWTPANVQCDSACQMRARTFYEPLTSYNDETKKVEPYLAKSVTANADSTEFTIGLRDGVTFSDGTPLNADAVVDNLNRARKSFLVGAALKDITDVAKVDDKTVVVKTKGPWYDFPAFLAGQAAFMASPTWLAAVDADPNKATQPVGTGPFMVTSFNAGESLTVKKNPTYWRASEGLPYLDEIEFRVIQDAGTRTSALEAGDIDMMQTDDGEAIKKVRGEADKFPMVEQSDFAETFYILLNVGQQGSPLQDQRVRCGLAAAIDPKVLDEAVGGGIHEIANGPFSPGQDGHLDDTGYPKYDPAKAADLISQYTAEKGKPKIIYSTVNDTNSLRQAELIQQFWQAAGVDVEVQQVEQSKLITNALLGDPAFNAFGWRNHAGLVLDTQKFWWDADNALPPGQLALNFGRLNDPVINDLLTKNRAEPDPAKRKTYAQDVNREFGKECWILPTTYTIWGVPAKASVKGIGQATFPGGTGKLRDGAGFPGQVWFNNVWIQQ